MKVNYRKVSATFLIIFCMVTTFAQRNGEQMTIPEYISLYSDLAKAEMRRTGIPASITLAQGILESNFGNSKLAKRAKNHFGIKCGSNWEGQTIYQNDDEKGECFRKYESVLHSYVDHSNFLIGKERYEFLFKLAPTDYKGWARGLKKAGYATNPNYANLLIRLIEERDLHRFDTEKKYQALTKEEEEYLKKYDNKYFTFNGIKTVIAQPNEMAIDIAYKYDVSLKSLLRYNDMEETDVIEPGSKIYLQPKRRKGYNDYHRVEEGETMHSISQHEGIKLKKLYKKNRMSWGQEPAVGEILSLRKRADEPPKLKTDEEIKDDIQKEINQKLDKITKKEEPEKEEKTTTEKEEEPVAEKEEVRVEEKNEEIIEKNEEPEEKVVSEETAVEEEVVEKEEVKEEEAITKEIPDKEENPKEKLSVEQPIYHSVEPQETLYRISKNYGVSIDQIKDWNNLASNDLYIGQQLIVGYETVEIEEDMAYNHDKEQEDDGPTYHKVQPQETLYSISKKYNIPVEDLKRINKLTGNDIQIGQVLKLKE